jgi:predicted GTPase
MKQKRIVIIGAAGRDFHNFNVLYRDNPDYRVVAFTAAQIPDIDDRVYPAGLAGERYSEGIPILAQEKLAEIIKEHSVDEVLFSYSDVPHQYVMHVGSQALAAGADFLLASPAATMLASKKPVISVCAVRTGCGKSQTTRYIADLLSQMGLQVVAIRHPMPYGDLSSQIVQRFATKEDMDKHNCTIEEMEEYEPHIEQGRVIYAGVDYQKILEQAEEEADVILWDGGNNDTPFIKPDLHVVVTDPHRVGHELTYYPGETNFLTADVLVINKIDSARSEDVETLENHIAEHNPDAAVVRADSKLFIDHPERIEGKRVLVVEDGPTLTHGEMKYGAGVIAAERYGAKEIVDPRPWIQGTLKATFRTYPGIGSLLPAMGYGEKQKHDLEETINATECDTVVIATPIDLNRIITIEKPTVRVTYELEELSPVPIQGQATPPKQSPQKAESPEQPPPQPQATSPGQPSSRPGNLQQIVATTIEELLT